VAVGVFIAAVGTVISMFSAGTSLDKTDCSVSHTFNDLLRGRKDKYSRFAGLKGLRHFFVDLKDELVFITPNTVSFYQLSSKSSDLETNLNAFHGSHSGTTVADCRGTGTVTPDIIHRLTDGINSNIKSELEMLI
jgi:hypothetical protein